MRRMIPESFVNWIKSLKDIIIKNDSKVEIGGSVEVDDDISATSLNGKDIPDYPASEGTFILKYVDGVLTWVTEEE